MLAGLSAAKAAELGGKVLFGPFDVEFLPVTHSVPHAHAVAIHTPQGVILHTGDFKLDLTPVDGRRTDLARIGVDASIAATCRQAAASLAAPGVQAAIGRRAVRRVVVVPGRLVNIVTG